MPDDPIEVEVVDIDDGPETHHASPREEMPGGVSMERSTERRYVRTTTSTPILSWIFGILLFVGILVFGLFALIGFLLLLLVRFILSLFRLPPSSSSLTRR